MNSGAFATLVHAKVSKFYFEQRQVDFTISTGCHVVCTTVLAVHVPSCVDGTRYRLVTGIILPADVLHRITEASEI